MSKSPLIDIINILETKYSNLKNDYKDLVTIIHTFLLKKEIKNILKNK